MAAIWPGTPAAARELKISHQFHASSDARGRAARIFAEELMLRAPELKVALFPQLALGLSRDEQLDALQAGKLDFAVLPLVFGVRKVPEFSLALLPGLIPNLATARTLKGSELHDKLQAVAAANGLRIVTWWWMPGGFATAKEVTTPASVKGLTLQSCGLAQKVLASAGARIADDPWGELSMRLEMGALDGVAVPYEDFISLRLAERAKFGTFGGPSILTCFSPMLMAKRTWDRLTAEQQRAVEEAAGVADTYFETSQIEAEKRALTAFRRAGAEVRALTHAEYMAWLQLAQRTAWADYVKASPASRDLLNTAIRVILLELGTKEEVIVSLFGADDK
ncbi:MAG: TRAP transporter substrate-binding protein DctP [Hyphomonadaceae bacterium]|nr:TRAP transporter substrate-binding protein DctP [Hyphomonadaceae bacterium]